MPRQTRTRGTTATVTDLEPSARRGSKAPADTGIERTEDDTRLAGAHPPSRPRSFGERVREHPIAVVLGMVVASVTATLTLVLPIGQLIQGSELAALRSSLGAQLAAAQMDVAELRRRLSAQEVDHRERVDELERTLGSIRLGIGSAEDYLDVDALLVERLREAEVPQGAAAYDERRFFALDPADGTGWSHEITTELHVIAEMLETSEAEVREAFGQFADLLVRHPLHLWRHESGHHRLRLASGDRLSLRTQVIVQRVAVAEAAELLGMPEGAAGRDLSGLLLVNELVGERVPVAQPALGGVPFIDALQKLGPTAYGKLQTTYLDVEVDGQPMERFMSLRDFLIVDTGEDVYLVKRSVALEDPRSGAAAPDARWLAAFRICTDCFLGQV